MAWRPTNRDAASTHVLEAVILGMVLLGAAYSVTAMRETGSPTASPRQKLEMLTEDALIVLDGLEEDRGSLLDLFLAEAYHCTYATAGHVDSCDGARASNLSRKLEHYLPHGIGYAYGVGNGVAQHTLYRSFLPEGETVTASRTIVPDWNLTFLASEMSCYEPTMEAELLALPIWHSRPATPVQLNLTVAGVNATATQSDGWYRASIPAGIAGIVEADVTANDGTYPGVASYELCPLDGGGPALLDAWRMGTFAIASDVVRVGEPATFSYDVASLALGGATIISSDVKFYAPLAPREGVPGGYVQVARSDFGASATGDGAWAVAPYNLYGTHVALLTTRVIASNGVELDLHAVDTVDVALSTGEVPIDPLYRVYLQTWFPDWS